MKPSPQLIKKIKELTGFIQEITVYESEAEISVFGNICGNSFECSNESQVLAELDFAESVRNYLTSDEYYEKQKIVVDDLLFKTMMLEECFCNIAAQSRHELGNLRTMELNRKIEGEKGADTYRRKRMLLIELEELRKDFKRYTSDKMRIVSKVFVDINNEGAIKARDLCIDFFNDAFELFIKHTAEAGTHIHAAISVKKPSWKAFMTIISK